MSAESAPFQLPLDEDHRVPLETVWWTTFAIATVFIVLRFWSRIYKRYLGLDDAFMVGSWLCFLGDAALIHYIAETGHTRHFLYLGSLPAIEEAIKLYIIVLDIGIFVTGLGKLAIGVTILRIIGDTSRWQKWLVWFVMFLTVTTSLTDFGITTFRCGAPENSWTIESWATNFCVSSEIHLNFNTFASAVQVFADFTFSILPMAIVWQMRLPSRQKIRVVTALGLTLITGAAGTVKAVYAATMDTSDLSWNIFPSLVWFAIEAMLIIVCGSIPSLNALYQRFFDHIQQTYGSKESKNLSYNSGQTASNPSHGTGKYSPSPSSRGTMNDPEAQFDAELARLTGYPVQPPPTASTGQSGHGRWVDGNIQVVREVDVDRGKMQNSYRPPH